MVLNEKYHQISLVKNDSKEGAPVEEKLNFLEDTDVYTEVKTMSGSNHIYI